MKAYTKDIIQTIKKGKKRFFAIMLITALGVCMLSALKASCEDLRYTADIFFDQQNLHDISIVSTLGLTDEDVAVLSSIDGIDKAEGTYSETVFTFVDDEKTQAVVKVLSNSEMDSPYLLDGRMPKIATEILVTEKYLMETGKKIGDTVEIQEKIKVPEDENEEEEEPNFLYTSFKIVGVVIDITDINGNEGAISFRSNSVTDYTFFIMAKAAKSDVYTAVNLTLDNTKELACYSEEYEAAVKEIVDYLEENIKEDREEARYAEIQNEALEEIADAEEEMNEEFADAEQEIQDAKEDLADGQEEIDKGLTDIQTAKNEIANKWIELNNGKALIASGKEELAKAEVDLLAQEKATFDEINSYKEPLESGIAQLEEAIEQTESAGGDASALHTQLQQLQQQLVPILAQEQQVTLQFNEAKITLATKKSELALKEAELFTGEAELIKAEEEIAKAEQELKDGQNEINSGKAELNENILDFENKKAEALEEIADAKKEVQDIKMTDWYIATRTSLSGYANVQTDADCIQAIGDAFPILFLTIAILISLTTISRMVEEDRGLIGTYKALGFTDKEIRRKYSIYSLIACIFGGILGDLMGFILLPKILFTIFDVMYQIPKYYLTFDWIYGIGGIILFVVGIVGSAIVSCETELSHMPATLMRPKAPRSGSRVLLERIPFIWKRLSFLNKVTVRNLFRYKKRFFMTIFGIAGCTSLLLCGFTIKDTVTELMPLQYEKVYSYDVMAVAEDNDKLVNYLDEEDGVASYLNGMISNVKIINSKGREETVQLIVIPDGENISNYAFLYDEEDQPITLEDGKVYVTINARDVLDFEKDDTVSLQNMQLELAEVTVSEVVINYLGNNVYMTENTYESLFSDYEPNGALIHLDEEKLNQSSFVNDLKTRDGILSAIGTDDLREGFKPAFKIINLVVYIVIVLAAALAFVVLFALATTNISERERELATIKVLGFFDSEVHLYVNKETIILTLIGIVLGYPLGELMGRWIMSVLEMPSIYFYVSLYDISYVISTIIAISFALIVNIITDRSLDKINPVEALKSIE